MCRRWHRDYIGRPYRIWDKRRESDSWRCWQGRGTGAMRDWNRREYGY